MVKWYKTYLEVYGKSFDEISDDSIRKVKRQLKERQNDSPLVSVVLIAHNEERHLISCIWSLSENHCHFPIEIIAVNNNSTDKTEEVLKSLGVTYYNETKKGPDTAANADWTMQKENIIFVLMQILYIHRITLKRM